MALEEEGWEAARYREGCRPARAAAAARHLAGDAPPGPWPWPRVACPAAHGPRTDPTAAILHRIDTGARARHRLA